MYRECGFCPSPAFLLGVWSVGVSQAERVPTWPAPVKTWALRLQRAPLVGNISQILWQLVAGGTTGETLGSLPLVSSGLLPMCLCPCAAFALYLFTGIKHSQECGYLLSLWVLIANHWACGWSWGPDTYETVVSCLFDRKQNQSKWMLVSEKHLIDSHEKFLPRKLSSVMKQDALVGCPTI